MTRKPNVKSLILEKGKINTTQIQEMRFTFRHALEEMKSKVQIIYS